MSAYVITVTGCDECGGGGVLTEFEPWPGNGPGPCPWCRRDAETLAAAHRAACESVHAAYARAYPIEPLGRGGEHSDAQRAHRWHALDALRIPAQGGTVGPLPDGRMIDVAPE